jgi:hypothetical protein
MRGFVTPEQLRSNPAGWADLYMQSFAIPRVFGQQPIGHAPKLTGWTQYLQDLISLEIDKHFGKGASLKPGAFERLMTTPRCGLPDVCLAPTDTMHGQRQFAYTDRWPNPKVRVYVNTANPTIPAHRIHEAWNWSFNQIHSVCGLQCSLVESKPECHVWAQFAPIDGPGNTLAWSYMVSRGILAANPAWQAEQRYDTGEPWSQELLNRTTLHEFLHALGIGHNASDPTSIMRPFINLAWNGFTRQDIDELLRYGEPKTRPEDKPVPKPDPKPEPPTNQLIAELDGYLQPYGPVRITITRK